MSKDLAARVLGVANCSAELLDSERATLKEAAAFIIGALESVARPEAAQIIVRTNEDASLDEAIVKGGYAHLEQMAADHWSLVMELGEQRIIIGLHANRVKIRAVLVDDGKVKLIDDSNASPLPQKSEG